MRVRTAWLVIAAVNVLWAAAFFGYTHRSTAPVQRGGEVVRVATPPPISSNKVVAGASQTNKPSLARAETNALVRVPAPASSNLVAMGREFGWQDVTNDLYTNYLARLRAAGCPEKQVRNIAVSDVNELFDKRRLEHAIRTDSPWWKSDNMMGMIQVQAAFTGGNFDQERRELFEKLLGPGWENTYKLPSLNPSGVNLAGPVLGALPADTWNAVQEVCSRSMEKHNNYLMSRMNEGQPYQMDSAEMAKLRDFTRTELAKILTPEQLEEFLLRYSHNSSKLRQDMRAVDITPDEFRKIFRAIDPLEHQVQLDYGSVEALSQKQREQLESQKERVIRETLTPQHYQQYQLTRDPLYKQAQLTALNYGLSAKAIQPIYDLQKSMDARRMEITRNNALTPEQKAEALQSVMVEQQQSLQRMMVDQNLR